jgi:hypothetical protein
MRRDTSEDASATEEREMLNQERDDRVVDRDGDRMICVDGRSPYRVVQDGERLIALEQVHGPTLPSSGRPAVREKGPGRT